ncbi:serine hydrolase [Rudanella paleaurantiibacter]|uniref:Serine hydrolase n=1 Tax=Rudanella paleaurantiibacter TaxID=2614655 RepID=A0A7J5TV89_9BACT|nr:serine hydrolase domain-containing protein [Rudanella paleaurantiibacter]KAB7728069.1 serine hydrolase [Rudanella paleaurantiibacter]
MTRYYALLFFLLLAGVTQAQSPVLLRQQLQQVLDEEKLVGAVWTTVDSAGQITVGCAGYRNKPAGQRLSPTDRVHVGSITKTVLAMGLLRLATEGKIRLDAPLSRYLPDLPMQNPWAKTHPVRVGHLLDHTAGLEDLRLWHMFSAEATPNTPLTEVFRRDPSVLQVRTRPGSAFAYSNIGYTLAAMVIEAVTGGRYETYLDAQLLKPLGMTRSTFQFVSQQADPTLAYGHLDNGEVVAALPIFLRPSTQLTTTAHDMGVLMRFLMSDGTLGGQPFIDPALLAQLGKPVGTDAARQGLASGYRLGLVTRDRYGVVGLAHSGNMVGYNAMLYLFPRQKKAFFITHNMDSETANYDRSNQVLVSYLNLPRPTPPSPNAQLPNGFAEWAGYYLPIVPKFEPLALLDRYTNVLQVRVQAQEIRIEPMQKEAFRLDYVGHRLFRAEGRQLPSTVFFRNDDGQMMLVADGRTPFVKTSGVWVWGVWLSLSLGLVGLFWLLLSGFVQWFRLGMSVRYRPIVWAWLGILLLLVPVPLLATQSFTTWGDFTAGSGLLALVTALLPLCLLLAGWRLWRSGFASFGTKLDGLAVLLSLQAVGLLVYWHLIPFRLWI